jgi:hypothetical protein
MMGGGASSAGTAAATCWPEVLFSDLIGALCRSYEAERDAASGEMGLGNAKEAEFSRLS